MTCHHPVRLALLILALAVTVLGLGILAADSPASSTGRWRTLEPGLEMARFRPPDGSAADTVITVLRVDPHRWDFRLFSTSQDSGKNRSIRQWSRDYGLTLAFNAGMYQQDYRSNVGYMQNFGHRNNAGVHPKHFSVAAFNPRRSGLAPFRIFDTEERGVKSVARDYHTVIQNLRLVKRPGINRWSPQEKRWSELALGQDRAGRVLVIFCRTPYSMHALNRILLALPLDLAAAQHLEGGPEAQLYLKLGDTELDLCGSFETGFFENDLNLTSFPVPNVIGIVPKTDSGTTGSAASP